MKCVLIVAFVTCACLSAKAQQSAEQTGLAFVAQPGNIGEPLYLILSSGAAKEISKAEFQKMDMNRVEYVKVLKDAASLDIYGERGKNGVVLIVLKGNVKRTRIH